MFKKSSDLRAGITYKILVYGPPGSGKTHFGLSAPQPAIIDFEHRAAHHAERFDFVSVAPESVRDGIVAIQQIADGKVPCKTLVLDSLSKPYQSFTRIYTKKTESGHESTDWPLVNRGMQNILDIVYSISNTNIISIARQMTKLERQGRDFKRVGVKFIGDEQRWPFDVDFMLHFVDRGLIEVQKSMSEHLPVTAQIRGDLDYARFVRLVTGEEPWNAKGRQAQIHAMPRPAPQSAVQPAASDNRAAIVAAFAGISDYRSRQLCALAASRKINDAGLLAIIREIAGDEPLNELGAQELQERLHAIKAGAA